MSTLKEYLKGDTFARNMGVEILEIQEGSAKGRLKVDERHMNANGFCQGGAIFTFADMIFAACMNSHLQVTVSTNSQIAFLRAVRPGTVLYAEAKEVYNHQRVPYAQVRIEDEDGELVALFSSHGYRRDDLRIPVDSLE